VVDLGREADLGRLEGVVGGESNGKEKDTPGIRRITLERPDVRSGASQSMKGLTGPMIVAVQLNIFSPAGPALQEEGGSRPRSINSYMRCGLSISVAK
jgi:hypothetical protein